MSTYNNIQTKLNELHMSLITSINDFNQLKIIQYKCDKEHISELTLNSYKNKITPSNIKKIKSFCAICNNNLIKKEECIEICTKLNFKLVSFDKNIKRNDSYDVKYECNCGNISKTDLRNLKKFNRKPNCPKCQNNKNKLNFDILVNEFKKRNCILLIKPNEYENNKQLLPYQCVCGRNGHIIFSDLKRNRLCKNCKVDRSKETSLLKYGEDNPSKNVMIQEKIKQTMLKNHGVEYAQQNPNIMSKTLSSSFMTKDFILPNNKIIKVLGYEPIVLDELIKEGIKNDCVFITQRLPLLL